MACAGLLGGPHWSRQALLGYSRSVRIRGSFALPPKLVETAREYAPIAYAERLALGIWLRWHSFGPRDQPCMPIKTDLGKFLNCKILL